MAKLLFIFLFFSFITKVEHGNYHITSHRVTEWSYHSYVTMKSQVTVTECDKGIT